MNTTKIQRNNLAQLNSFRVNDEISIYNSITGNFSFNAIIVSIEDSCIKDGQFLRLAAIKLNNGVIISNTLGSARLNN